MLWLKYHDMPNDVIKSTLNSLKIARNKKALISS